MNTDVNTASSPVALVTGGSAGLGLELVRSLSAHGWTVLTDGRDGVRLHSETRDLPGVRAVPGDVSDPTHRTELVAAIQRIDRLDLLVHSASTLGPTPMRPLRDLRAADLRAVWDVNVAPALDLTRDLLPLLTASRGVLLSISSDAAVEHYETWGAYAASKAALDHLTLTWGAEEGLDAYAVDPGDMRTAMHQAAFPGEDISDRPLPSTVVPHLMALLEQRPPSGRLRARDISAEVSV